jgi:sialate O-acetylesterase
MISRSLVRAACALSLAFCVQAEVRLPGIFSDHMLVQSGTAVRVWGTASPGEAVTAAFRGKTVEAKASADGRWQLFLPPGAAGGPFVLAVNGRDIQDVLVGEVWVASGQSNMGFRMNRVDNAERETAAANLPRIRYFQVKRVYASQPKDELEGEWRVASPETAPAMSAVAFLFARGVHEARRVPVGIVEAAVGGTPAQAWTPLDKLKRDPLLTFHLANWEKIKATTPQKHWEPSGCFNGMIWPIRRYTIRGAIWYQGENNGSRGEGDSYNRLFETMIRSWRELWGQGDFPFLFVQLPNFGKPQRPSQWPEVREAQLQTLTLRNTGMAVAIDVGNPGDVHPTNKRPVAERLVLAARALVYGERVAYSGPIVRRVTAEDGALRVWFDFAEGMAGKGGAPLGFEVAGADGNFVEAKARVDGATVILSADGVAEPKRVRYAWGNDPPNNLYNAAGLPASPFRAAVE